MIQEKDISINYKDKETHLEVTAGLYMGAIQPIMNETIFGYKHRQDLLKTAENHLKRTILHNIYGEIEKQARESYLKVKKIVQYNPHFSYDNWKELDEAFAPLLNIVKISENKVEQEEN